jgi:hypothetical protein
LLIFSFGVAITKLTIFYVLYNPNNKKDSKKIISFFTNKKKMRQKNKNEKSILKFSKF